MVAVEGEWIGGISILRTSLGGSEPAEDNWGNGGEKNIHRNSKQRKGVDSQHSELIDTLKHKCYEWLTASFKFLL